MKKTAKRIIRTLLLPATATISHSEAKENRITCWHQNTMTDSVQEEIFPKIQ